jgi:hypothetical protein
MSQNALHHAQLIAGLSNRFGWRIFEWVALTGTSRPTVWRQIKRGKLKVVDVNGIKLIPRSEAIRLGLLAEP